MLGGSIGARTRRTAVLAPTLLLAGAGVLLTGPVPAGAAPVAAACTAANSVDYTGRHLGAADLRGIDSFDCANLAGADLSGLTLDQKSFRGADLQGADLSNAILIQVDLTGANLRNATGVHARMGQATVQNAVFAGANLEYADLSQANAFGADFTGTDLRGADLSQADLRTAHLDGATIAGTSFVQAELSGTTFRNPVGLHRWDPALAAAAVALLVLLLLPVLLTFPRTRLRYRHPVRRLGLAVLGRVVLVLGLHLVIGATVGLISASGPPTVAPCRGPWCAVGIDAGGIGLGTGVFLVVAAILLLATAGALSGRSWAAPNGGSPLFLGGNSAVTGGWSGRFRGGNS